MNAIIKILVIILIPMLVACGEDESESVDILQTSTQSCGNQPASILFPGINESDAKLVLEGNTQVTDRMLSQLLKDKLSRTPLEKCQYHFWLDVAATNGSIQAAYEHGQSGATDPIGCHRSKFWAKSVLGRTEELRGQYVEGTPESFIQSQLKLINRQMQTTLAKKCLPFKARPME